MESRLANVLFLAVYFLHCKGLAHSLVASPCGDWTPFKNETCVKLVNQAGLQTKDDSEIVCNALAEEFHGDILPKLVMVKTQEEQQFLQKLIFEELKHLDSVWLGIELGTDDVFRWNDGIELVFTNWDEETVTDKERRCVQMESGEGTLERGKWVRANCKKRNSIVCERTQQPWSIAALQEAILNLELKVTRNKEESEQKLNDAKEEAEQKIAAAKQEIENLKQNQVPVGFIYMQLPSHDPPTIIWPALKWSDVTSTYAGLFFRAAGGSAAAFGVEQPDNTRRVKNMFNPWWQGVDNVIIEIPDNGSWSGAVWSGSSAKGRNIGMMFQTTTGEIRPRNKAVKIWQRIN